MSRHGLLFIRSGGEFDGEAEIEGIDYGEPAKLSLIELELTLPQSYRAARLWIMQVAAVQALTKIGEPAVPRIQRVLSHPDRTARECAAFALQEIEGTDHGQNRAKWQPLFQLLTESKAVGSHGE